MSAPVVIVMLSETGIEIATAYTTSERETSIKKDGRNHLPLASFASPCLIRLLSVSIPDILGYCQKHSRHLTQEGPINTCGRCKWISSDNRRPVLCRRGGEWTYPRVEAGHRHLRGGGDTSDPLGPNFHVLIVWVVGDDVLCFPYLHERCNECVCDRDVWV